MTISVRIYVAGAMTGMPRKNRPLFNEAAAYLRSFGYEVENPAENPSCRTWQLYMRQSIKQMLRCDAIALLEGWPLSKGARLEALIARQLGMPAIYL